MSINWGVFEEQCTVVVVSAEAYDETHGKLDKFVIPKEAVNADLFCNIAFQEPAR